MLVTIGQMPQPDDRPEEALNRLGQDLKAFEAGRQRTASPEASGSMGEGYRLLWELVSGVLGGAALGWLVDRLAGTGGWGVAIGLAVGAGVGVFMACLTAVRISRRALAKAGPLPVVTDDDDD